MFKFLKESVKEFDHVVWPTNKETRNYFISVSSIILILTVILFVFSTFFSSALFTLKENINPVKITKDTINSNAASTGTTTDTKDVKIPTTTTK